MIEPELANEQELVNEPEVKQKLANEPELTNELELLNELCSGSLASSSLSTSSFSLTSSGSFICKLRLGDHQLQLGDNLNFFVFFYKYPPPPY